MRVEYRDGWIEEGYAFIKLSSTFDQNNVSQFETSTSGYHLLSAGLGGKIKVLDNDLSISVSGNNLTDKNYFNHLSRLKPDGIYNIGRNITLGLTYSL
jgi:iron complex outermembrane receptor protein